MFEILCESVVVGSAEMKREGLYYKIHCTCTPPNDRIHRITVSDGTTVRDLGICVPSGTKFTLTARLPMKCFQSEKLSFALVTQDRTGTPVSDGAPFDRLDDLEAARLQITDGQPEIIIDSVPDPQDSGRSQEYPNR